MGPQNGKLTRLLLRLLLFTRALRHVRIAPDLGEGRGLRAALLARQPPARRDALAEGPRSRERILEPPDSVRKAGLRGRIRRLAVAILLMPV